MSVVTTQVQVANLALKILNANQISSFSDGTQEADSMNQFYELYVRTALQSHDWRFAITEQECSRLSSSPIPQWEYAYELPADILNIRAVYDSDSAGARCPYKRYQIFADNTLCTDTKNGIWVHYKQRVFETRWPAHFVNFCSYYLALMLCPIIGRQFDFQQALFKQIYGMGGESIFNQACTIDSTQYPPEPLDSYYFQSARWSF